MPLEWRAEGEEVEQGCDGRNAMPLEWRAEGEEVERG